MSKTTPEEAEVLAQKHFIGTIFDCDYHQLAALIDEARGVDAEPFMHVYEFASPFGGTVWRDSPDTWNGNQPKRSLPLYTNPAPSQPAAPVELPVVGALWEYIGNDPMGHRTRPCARALHEMNPDNPPYSDTWRVVDKVVKLSDAQAAIAAGRKA